MTPAMADAVPSLRPRHGLVVVVVVLLTLAGAGARAVACVPQPYILVQPRASGPPGATVDVVGANFEMDEAELRWNALDGVLLAKASGRSFSTSVTIPDEPEGLYALLAISRGAQGEIFEVARTPFSVTSTGRDAKETSTSPTESGSSSPVLPMLAGAGLVVLAGAGGAAIARRTASRSSPSRSGPSSPG
jgi:hypothetical protein